MGHITTTQTLVMLHLNTMGEDCPQGELYLRWSTCQLVAKTRTEELETENKGLPTINM